MLRFPERLRKFKELYKLSDAKLGGMLGIHGQSVGQIIREEKGYSHPLEVLLDHLEREAADDPFLAACAKILGSSDDRIVQGFTMNVYSVLSNLDPGEAKRLKDLEREYLAKRRAERKARSAG